MIVEKCCHDMDLMLWLTGTRPSRVASLDGLSHGGAEVPMAEDIVACMFEGEPMPTTLADGVAASFVSLGLDEARERGGIIDMNTYWSHRDA